MSNEDDVIETKYPVGALPEDAYEDFLAGVKACDRQDPECEACQ